MSGRESLEQRIAHFEALLEEMKIETREAHSALKHLTKKKEEVERMLGRDVKEMINEAVSKIVKEELDKLGPDLRKNTNRIYERVGKEIDKLIDISLGPDFSRRHDRPNLRPLLAERLKVWLQEQIDESEI